MTKELQKKYIHLFVNKVTQTKETQRKYESKIKYDDYLVNKPTVQTVSFLRKQETKEEISLKETYRKPSMTVRRTNSLMVHLMEMRKSKFWRTMI